MAKVKAKPSDPFAYDSESYDLRLLPPQIANEFAKWAEVDYPAEDCAERALEAWAPFITFHVDNTGPGKPIRYARLSWREAIEDEIEGRRKGREVRQAAESAARQKEREVLEAEMAILHQPHP